MNATRALSAVFLVLSATIPPIAHGQEPPPAQAAAQQAVVRVNSEIGIAVSGLFQNYQESFADPRSYDSEAGGTPGFAIKATAMFNAAGIDHLYAGLHYSFNNGNVAYDGDSIGSFRPIHMSVGEQINDVNVEFGKGFLITPRLLLLPVVQMDYRDWLRTVPNGFSPQEDYSYVAPGLALRASYAATDRLVLNGKLGWEYTISPTDDAAANPGLGVPAVTLKLGSRSVWQVTAGADYALTDRVHLFGEVQYQHLDFGRSPVSFYQTSGGTAGVYEPTGRTDDVLLQLGLAYAF